MATTTFLSNATINITQGATTTDMSDNANACSITVGQAALSSTAFGDTGERFVGGLQSVEVAITFYLSYGASEVEAVLASCVGTGTTTLVISPSGTTESASNPEYTIKVTTDQTTYEVKTNLYVIIAWERKFKQKASNLATGVGLEDLAFMAFESFKVHGIPTKAIFDDYVKTLVAIEVITDEPTNPIEEAPTHDH